MYTSIRSQVFPSVPLFLCCLSAHLFHCLSLSLTRLGGAPQGAPAEVQRGPAFCCELHRASQRLPLNWDSFLFSSSKPKKMLPYLNKYSFYPVLFNIFLALFVSGGPLRCRRRGTRGYRGRAPRKAWDVFVGPLCATDKVYFFCSFFIKERDIHLGAPSISLVLQRQEPTRHVSWGPLSSWRCCCCRSFVLQPLHLCLWDRAIPATALRQHATEACSAAVAAVSAAIAAAAAGGPHQEPHPPFPQRGLCRSVLASPSCGCRRSSSSCCCSFCSRTMGPLRSNYSSKASCCSSASTHLRSLSIPCCCCCTFCRCSSSRREDPASVFSSGIPWFGEAPTPSFLAAAAAVKERGAP